MSVTYFTIKYHIYLIYFYISLKYRKLPIFYLISKITLWNRFYYSYFGNEVTDDQRNQRGKKTHHQSHRFGNILAQARISLQEYATSQSMFLLHGHTIWNSFHSLCEQLLEISSSAHVFFKHFYCFVVLGKYLVINLV